MESAEEIRLAVLTLDLFCRVLAMFTQSESSISQKVSSPNLYDSRWYDDRYWSDSKRCLRRNDPVYNR